MLAYPESWVDAARVVIVELPKLRSGEASKSKLAQAAWNLQGYAQGRFIPPDGVTSVGAAEPDRTPLTDGELCEALRASVPAPGEVGGSNVPWGAIGRALFLLIARLLDIKLEVTR